MAIEGIRKVVGISMGHPEVVSPCTVPSPNPEQHSTCAGTFNAYPLVNVAFDKGFFIIGLDKANIKTAPFQEIPSEELEEATRQEGCYVPPQLAKGRHAALKEGFFVTDDTENGGFLLYLPTGVRHFGAYQVETDKGLITFYKNTGHVSVRPLSDLYAHTLRNPETIVLVPISVR